MPKLCSLCQVEANENNSQERCPKNLHRLGSPYIHGHDWYDTEDKLWRISVSGGTKYNKEYQSGFIWGASSSLAWSNFCRLYNINPRAIKNAYIYELKDIKDVIWYLKPEHNVAYA